MRYVSVCSGIEAASVAWHPLGFTPVAFAEIDPFASAVLAARWPGVHNVGDFTDFSRIEGVLSGGDQAPVDLLVGGTPCQSFSVAGQRGGLDDPRGNLALEYLRLAQRLRTRWILWENVPGVLSSNGGRDFGAFLGAVEDSGYGWAYRILDAQHFGLAQRRKRLFVVGCLGDWASPAKVLLEPESVRGHPAPSREERKNITGTLTASSGGCDENDAANGRLIVHTLQVVAYQCQGTNVGEAGTLRAGNGGLTEGVPFIVAPLAGHHPRGRVPLVVRTAEVCPTLRAGGNRTGGHRPPGTDVDTVTSLVVEIRTAHTSANGQAVFHTAVVRRLTPRECERLQGFPDDYTLVPYRGKPAADGPRYKAIGNSMAVPVIRWIGSRIAAQDAVRTARNTGPETENTSGANNHENHLRRNPPT